MLIGLYFENWRWAQIILIGRDEQVLKEGNGFIFKLEWSETKKRRLANAEKMKSIHFPLSGQCDSTAALYTTQEEETPKSARTEFIIVLFFLFLKERITYAVLLFLSKQSLITHNHTICYYAEQNWRVA